MINDRQHDDVQPLTLQLSGEAMETVRQIARTRGLTVPEVIRRAIGTEAYFTEARERGDRILLEDRDKRIREVVLR